MQLDHLRRTFLDGVARRPGWSLLLAAHLPFTAVYFFDLWRFSTHYHFFPFAVLAFLWLFASRRRDAPEHWGWFQWSLVAADIACLGVGVAIYSPWMVAFGLFLSLLAWCSACEDRDYCRRLTYLALLPALLIRLPLNGDLILTGVLQDATTRVASRLLLRLDFLHLRHGNVIEFADRRFLVEEACSGVQSLFTVLFLAALIVCWKRRTLPYAALFIPSGMLFAGIMNVTRIVAIAVAWTTWGLDLSSGLAHDVIGYLSLLIAVLLLLSADRFLGCLADPVPDVRRPGPASLWFNPLISGWNGLFGFRPRPPEPAAVRGSSADRSQPAAPRSWPLRPAVILSGLFFLILSGLQGAAIYAEMTEVRLPTRATTQAILKQNDLSDQIAGFVQSEYRETHRSAGNIQGEFSNSWMYRSPASAALVSCDHPFVGWHQLHQCYLKSGWTLDSQEVVNGPGDWGAVVLRLSRGHGGEFATVIYSHFDRSGEPIQPPELHRIGSMGLEHILRNRRVGLLDSISIQSQVYAKSVVRMDDETTDQLLQLHFDSRENMRAAIEERVRDQ